MGGAPSNNQALKGNDKTSNQSFFRWIQPKIKWADNLNAAILAAKKIWKISHQRTQESTEARVKELINKFCLEYVLLDTYTERERKRKEICHITQGASTHAPLASIWRGRVG